MQSLIIKLAAPYLIISFKDFKYKNLGQTYLSLYLIKSQIDFSMHKTLL